MSQTFFLPRSERPELVGVRTDYPFPLAVTYERLHTAMDRQQPVEAAWALRDCFECTIKFCASVGIADVLHSGASDEERMHELVGCLLRPGGRTFGDWVYLLRRSLDPELTTRQTRALPELQAAFFRPNGNATNVTKELFDSQPKLDAKDWLDKVNVVQWRNKIFGHGVFRDSPQWYADRVTARLPHLNRLFEALRPLADAGNLGAATPDGPVSWRGCDGTRGPAPHTHQPEGEPLALEWTRPAAESLPLPPFLTVQVCRECREPTPFFFDLHDSGKRRTEFLEYFHGTLNSRKDWEPVAGLASLLPPQFKWVRSAYDQQEVEESLKIEFSDFDYLRPGYLIDPFWERLDDRASGYFQRLVEAGQTELEHVLAGALMNNGMALKMHGRLPEALATYDRAIGILERLVEGGQIELEEELACVLMNKGVALKNLQLWSEVQSCYDRAISIQARLIEGGHHSLIPDLLRSLSFRYDLFRQLREWFAAAQDIVTLINLALQHRQEGDRAKAIDNELRPPLKSVAMLEATDRAALDAALGENAETVQSLIDQFL